MWMIIHTMQPAPLYQMGAQKSVYSVYMTLTFWRPVAAVGREGGTPGRLLHTGAPVRGRLQRRRSTAAPLSNRRPQQLLLTAAPVVGAFIAARLTL